MERDRGRRTAAARRLAALAMTGLAVVGCGDDAGSDESGAASGAVGLVAMLGRLPAPAGGDARVVIGYGDIATATALAGVERPDDPTDPEVATWLMAISGFSLDDAETTVAVPLPEIVVDAAPDRLAEVVDDIGWSALDLDVFIELSTPPESFTVVAGDVGADDLDDHVGEAVDGIWTAGEGDDFTISPDDRTPVRPLGTPLHMAVAPDSLLGISPSTPMVQAWLAGDGSMADDAAMLAVAERLDAAGVHSAILFGPDDDTTYDALGAGWSHVDGEPVGRLVLHFADGAAAADGAARLEAALAGSADSGRPWSEVFASSDVTVDGVDVVAEIRLAADVPARVLWQALLANDSIVRI